jgi:hypothetical protein
MSLLAALFLIPLFLSAQEIHDAARKYYTMKMGDDTAWEYKIIFLTDEDSPLLAAGSFNL